MGNWLIETIYRKPKSHGRLWAMTKTIMITILLSVTHGNRLNKQKN